MIIELTTGEIRSEITSMMDTLQKQLDLLDDIFEKMEQSEQKEEKEREENCFCKFLNRIFKRD